MADDDLATCLSFVRDWNTTAQHSLTAQRLVYNLLKVKPIGTLVGTPQIQSLLEAIIPYTERHFERIDRLVQGATLLSYTLEKMRMLASAPALDPKTAAAEPAKPEAAAGAKRQRL